MRATNLRVERAAVAATELSLARCAELYLALNKETADAVVKKLQAALDAMRADGFAAEVEKRYL